ncbi:hypothetical protein EDD11_007906 [Mortierella claussenii]|nr:hypothetical protein EDD11_007906 [Mortierella claussenii]
MTNSLNLPSLTGASSSQKDMRLSIQVHGSSFISINGKAVPVFYSTLETPVHIRATVTLETDKECAGHAVEILYKAGATYQAPVRQTFTVFTDSDHFFQRKRWTMESLVHPEDGRVAAGKYTKEIGATIDPLWPSSGVTATHSEGHGWIRYSFEAVFWKRRFGAPIPILSDYIEVWVLNSALSSPSQGLLENDMSMGAIVPVTVKMGSFSGKFKDQAIVVTAAHFALIEKVDGRANGATQKYTYEKSVINVPIPVEGWPKSVGPWEKAISLTMPTTPELVANCKTRWMDVTHFIVLKMKIRAEDEKESKAEEYEIRAEVDIVVPRRAMEDADDVLPLYSPSHPTQSIHDPLNYQQPQHQDVKA